ELRYAKRQWSAGVSAGRMIDPGNGIVLTNRNTRASGDIRYNARRWNAGAGVSYSEMRALKLERADYNSRSAHVGFSVVMGKGFSWNNSFSARRYGGGSSILSDRFFDRTQYRVSTGIYWSPSAFPLPLF